MKLGEEETAVNNKLALAGGGRRGEENEGEGGGGGREIANAPPMSRKKVSLSHPYSSRFFFGDSSQLVFCESLKWRFQGLVFFGGRKKRKALEGLRSCSSSFSLPLSLKRLPDGSEGQDSPNL